MIPKQARELQPGDLVQVHVAAEGGVELLSGEMIEVTLPKGCIAKVDFVQTIDGPQGYGVWVSFDNGIGNIFDEADPEPQFPFTKVEPSDSLTVTRISQLLNNAPSNYPPADLLGDIDYILTGERS